VGDLRCVIGIQQRSALMAMIMISFGEE